MNMSPAIKDLRRHNRFGLRIEASEGMLMFTNQIRIIDLSLGGVAFETTKHVIIGNAYACKLKDISRVLSLRGLVVWSSLCSSRRAAMGDIIPVYTVGLSFTEEESGGLRGLSEFVEANRHAPTAADTDDVVCPGLFENAPFIFAAEPLPTVSCEFLNTVDYLFKWHKSMGYYKFLGIPEYANQRQIAEAFHSVAQTFSPARFRQVPDDVRTKMHEIFAYAADAYYTLMDVHKRRDYNCRAAARIKG